MLTISIQNDKGNEYSNTVIVGAISSKYKRTDLPTHVYICDNLALPKNSVVLLEQIKSLGINTDWVKGGVIHSLLLFIFIINKLLSNFGVISIRCEPLIFML